MYSKYVLLQVLVDSQLRLRLVEMVPRGKGPKDWKTEKARTATLPPWLIGLSFAAPEWKRTFLLCTAVRTNDEIEADWQDRTGLESSARVAYCEQCWRSFSVATRIFAYEDTKKVLVRLVEFDWYTKQNDHICRPISRPMNWWTDGLMDWWTGDWLIDRRTLEKRGYGEMQRMGVCPWVVLSWISRSLALYISPPRACPTKPGCGC